MPAEGARRRGCRSRRGRPHVPPGGRDGPLESRYRQSRHACAPTLCRLRDARSARRRHEANAGSARLAAALARIGGPYRADEEIARSDPRDGGVRSRKSGQRDDPRRPNGARPGAHERGEAEATPRDPRVQRPWRTRRAATRRGSACTSCRSRTSTGRCARCPGAR
jgi:hypothetical protein